MASVINPVQDIPKSPTDRITGFPEPFSADRNTTLPHPSADTSPNATIIAEDYPRPGSRRSRSFLSRKGSHRSGHRPGKSIDITNGTVTVLPMPKNGDKGLYDGIQYADDAGTESRGSEKGSDKGSEEGRVSRDEEERHGDEEDQHDGREKKKGLLRKFRRS